MTDLNWRTDAACLGVGGEAFFAEDDSKGAKYTKALDVCAGCPVKAPCLELGMGTDIGVYGGATPSDRRLIRRQRSRQRRAA